MTTKASEPTFRRWARDGATMELIAKVAQVQEAFPELKITLSVEPTQDAKQRAALVLERAATAAKTPQEMLRHHVSGAIDRGEKVAITEVRKPRRRIMPPEERQAVSSRMKSYWASRRAAKRRKARG